VRWRGRRVYDYPLNAARYLLEVVLRAIGFGRPALVTFDRIGSDAQGQHDLDRLRYRELRSINDDVAAAAMPRWYWRCSACHRCGQIFDSSASNDAIRGAITRIEDRIEDEGGAVINPVGGDDLPDH
jgi:hypothetical protein